MKAATRLCIVGFGTAIAVVIVVIVPMLCDIREALTIAGTVHVENTLGTTIVIEDVHKWRKLARIQTQSHWSARLPLADSEGGRSLTTFRVITSDGRRVEIESKTFLDHRAEVRDHGVDLCATAGRAARTVTQTIDWHSTQQLEVK